MKNAEFVQWMERATEAEVNALELAINAWSEKGIRTIQAFFAAAHNDHVIANLLPENLAQQVGLRKVHSRGDVIGEQAAG